MREQQFEALLREHSDGIHRLALALLRNRHDAEDATQEVLVKLWQKLPRFSLLNQRAWVYRITRNHCLDKLRSRNSGLNGRLTELTELPESEYATGQSTQRPGESVDQATVERSIQSALQQLPEQLRSVFLLYEINQLPHREIATVLGIPTGSSKVYLHRARNALKTILNRNDPWIQNYVKS